MTHIRRYGDVHRSFFSLNVYRHLCPARRSRRNIPFAGPVGARRSKTKKGKMENGLETALGYVWIGERSFLFEKKVKLNCTTGFLLLLFHVSTGNQPIFVMVSVLHFLVALLRSRYNTVEGCVRVLLAVLDTRSPQEFEDSRRRSQLE